MTDQKLTCAECGKEFIFTAGEAEFYAGKGFEPPKRCPECRAASKAKHNKPFRKDDKKDN